MGLNDYAAEGVWEWSDGTTYLEYISYVPPYPHIAPPTPEVVTVFEKIYTHK